MNWSNVVQGAVPVLTLIACAWNAWTSKTVQAALLQFKLELIERISKTETKAEVLGATVDLLLTVDGRGNTSSVYRKPSVERVP